MIDGCIKGVVMESKHMYRSALEQLVKYVEEKDKSFLVTGASGLIGSCIIDLLALANENGKTNHIYALGRNAKRIKNRFSDNLESAYFHIIEQDICCPLDDSFHFDYIIHCASYADPIKYAKYPVETMKTNMLGGINVLEYAKKHKECRVELLSSFEVYGNAGKSEYSETDVGILDFNQLRACYPESKRVLETLAKSYLEEYGVQVIIGRLSSVYGPTMTIDDSKAHAQFIRNAIEGKSIVLKSKGEQKRTYCYVMDAVSGIMCVLFRGKIGETYNISYEKSVITIAALAQIIADKAESKVVFDAPSDAEKKGFSTSQDCILNNNKLKALGWEGRYDLNHGITECISILSNNFGKGA